MVVQGIMTYIGQVIATMMDKMTMCVQRLSITTYGLYSHRKVVDVGQRGPLDAAGGDAECTVARCSRVVHFFRAWMYQDPCVHGRGLPLLVVPRVVEHPLEHLGHGGCRNLFHILCDIRRLLRLLSTKRRHVILLLRHTSWNGWSGEGDMRQAT